MPAMATDTQEFAAVPLTPPNPGESVGAKEYFKVISSTVIRKFRLLGRAAIEQEMLIGASSTAPTVANGAQGSSTSVVAGSSDAVGAVNSTVTVTPGTVAVITFGVALPAAPRMISVTSNNATGAFGVTASSATGFTISSTVAPTAAATVLSYVVIP